MIAALLALAALPGGDLAAIEKRLRSPDEKERRAAVQELGDERSAAAWKLVVGAFKDPAPMVADEAEIQAARIADVDGLAELVGKSGLLAGDTWVQTRAAGALGGVEAGVEPALVLKGLEDPDAEVRRTLCASVEALARRGKLGEDKGGRLAASLDRLRKKDPDPAVRGAALLARAACAADRGPLLAEAAKDAAPEVQCALVLATAEYAPGDVAAALAPLAASASPGVRMQVVRALERLRTGTAAGLLVERIGAETSPRIAWAIADVLETWSGVRGGTDAQIWRGWYEKLGPDWRPSTGERPAARGDTGTAVLYGMPLLSNRVTILVDLSGSMWEERAGGKTRKQLVDLELRKALEAFPADAKFNLIPYTGAPIPWEKRLVPATPANVKRALEFFEGCKQQGKGNVWDAALLALEDPEVDTLLVLFDGAPTGGHRWNIDLMRERFAERNRFRAVTFDALVFDAKKGIQGRWQAFCAATGGRMLAIEL